MTRRQFSTLIGTIPFAARAQSKPNFIVILMDDMGYGDIGSYGVTDIKTPNIDRLAQEGVRLTDFYSNGPVCTPTRCALMTGRYQQRVGLEWALTPPAIEAGLPASEISLASMLRRSGYRTAIYGKWHLGWNEEFSPLKHGFEEYFGILGGNADMYSHKNRFDSPHELYEGTGKVERPGYLTDLISDRAVQFIEKHAAEPFFLYIPYNAVHWPFQKPGTPDDVRTTATWYDGTRQDYARMLEGVDAGIGRVLNALDKAGVARNTMVVFTNDNGGERLSRNEPLFHHKATLWEGGIRVPCIVRWPAQLPAGKSSAQVGATMDITATILAAANVAPPPERELDGVNLLRMLKGEQPLMERTLFWRIERNDRKQRAVRQGKWKYIRDGNIDNLYDLESDVSERIDVGYRHPAKLAALRRALAAWEKDVDSGAKPFNVR